MITPQNRIIIVDDSTEELNRLSKAFLNTGIGCRTFEYDKTYNTPLNGIRIAFFDVNLGEENVETDGLTPEQIETLLSPVFNQLAYALNQYIAKDNGPFVLVFWTKNKALIEGFNKYIEDPERNYSDTAKPFLIDCFDKTEIDENNVTEKLGELFNDQKIKFLFELEEFARIAGSRTINKLHDIIPKDDKWSHNTLYFENIDKVLSKISLNVLGYEYAKANPLRGVYEGLSQLILKEFLDQDSTVNADLILSSLIGSDSQKEIQFPDDSIASKLNSIFHIDYRNDFPYSTRGGVYKFDLNKLESIDFDPVYHFSLSEYFKNITAFNEEIFFRYKSTTSPDLIDEIKNKTEYVAIEISASCDYSQNKKRNNKFILGLITPDISEHIESTSISKSILFKDIPKFQFDSEDCELYLNLNYVFSDSELAFLGEPLFILKKELIDMIGNRYANHVSRIGITSF